MSRHFNLYPVAEPGAAGCMCPFFAPGVNTLRAAFLEPEMRAFYRDRQRWVNAICDTRSAARLAASRVAHLTTRPSTGRERWV
ncbi:hypothetical protein AB0M95_20240 [Sphaerisporangium sp. NPDC051017]|uniref:hypothetical protein n=1 Tax=Sphaerisporangium sp. NPDC051017 TaxID=3154636 RepID=UPI00341969BA